LPITLGEAKTAPASTNTLISAIFHFSKTIMSCFSGDQESDQLFLFIGFRGRFDWVAIFVTDFRDHGTDDFNHHTRCDFHINGFAAFSRFGDFAFQATGGDDHIAFFHVVDQLAMFFRAFLLRPDQQEVKNNKDQQERKQLSKRTTTTGGGLGISWGNKHEGLHVRN